MKPYRDNYRDQRVVDDSLQQLGERMALSCLAQGCPNRWSVDLGSGRLCSAHAWAERRDWPAITAQQQDADAERVRLASQPKLVALPLSHAEKGGLLRRLSAAAAGFGHGNRRDPKAWAWALRDREEAGECLTPFQRQCWRDALGRGADVVDTKLSGGDLPDNETATESFALRPALPIPPRCAPGEAEYFAAGSDR